MPIMKTSFLLLALTAALAGGAQAQVVSWNFTGDPGNQASEAAAFSLPNVTGSPITRGSGLTASAAATSFSSAGWESTASGSGSNEYLSFGFTVADGYLLDLSQLLVGTRSSNTGPGTLGLFYSFDNYASQLYTFTQSGTSTLVSNINLSSLPNLFGSVEFRIFEIGNTSASNGITASTGTFRLTGTDAQNNMVFAGAVTAVPEPESFAMLLAGLGIVGAVTRRRTSQAQA